VGELARPCPRGVDDHIGVDHHIFACGHVAYLRSCDTAFALVALQEEFNHLMVDEEGGSGLAGGLGAGVGGEKAISSGVGKLKDAAGARVEQRLCFARSRDG
jgi:hypothetical protein